MSKRMEDRRRSTRIPIQVPVTVRRQDGTEQKCSTRDVSSGGLFIYCNAQLAEDAPVDLVLILPPEIIGGSRTQWVCCHAKVARVEPASADGRHGFALQTERIEILPEITAVE